MNAYISSCVMMGRLTASRYIPLGFFHMYVNLRRKRLAKTPATSKGRKAKHQAFCFMFQESHSARW